MATLTGKTIAELTADTSLSGSELFPVMDGATSKKVAIGTIDGRYAMVENGTQLAASTNLDDIKTPGTYWTSNGADMDQATCPTTYAFKMTVTRVYTSGGEPRLWQILQVVSSACIEYRRCYTTTNTWGDWQRLDIGGTTSAITALQTLLGGSKVSFTPFNVASSTTETLALANGKHGIIFFTSLSSTLVGVYAVACNSSTGNVGCYPLVEASKITPTGGTNVLSIENTQTSAYTAFGLYMEYST